MTPTALEAKREELRDLLNTAIASHVEVRIASTAQLKDIMKDADLVKKGIETLNTIGLMLIPEMNEGDEPISMARRSDMAKLFEFFGEVLSEPIARIYETADLIDIRGDRA